MFGLRGLVASCLLATALASPHLISADISGPRIETTRGLKNAGIRRDSQLFSREPGAPMVRRNGLVARSDSKTISFEQTLENQVIFNSTAIPGFPGPSLEVVCANCCSKGGVKATYPGDLEDIINPKFRIDLEDIEVYVELDVVVSDSNQFSIPLLPFLPGLTGIELPGIKAGLFVDLLLVFQISGKADLSGGFYIKIPKGSFFEIDISEDADTSQEFTDVISKALPVTINNDDTGIEFKAALQLKAEFGISSSTDGNDISIPGVGGVDLPFVDVPDLGAGAIVGAYVNLVEYVANVSPEDDCALEAAQELNLNMGVFAKVGVSIKDEFLGLRPSATTTLLTLPLPTACLLETGLPIPTRKTPLPPQGECGAETTSSANGNEDDVEDEDEDVGAKTTQKSITKRIAAPLPTASPYALGRRGEPSTKEVTAVACVSELADCPEDLQTTITYKTTLCDAPAKTGSCFAVSDAKTLDATSVVNTAAARATAGVNAVRADEVSGTGTGTGTGSAPKATDVEGEDECAEDDLDDNSSEDDSASSSADGTSAVTLPASSTSGPSSSVNSVTPVPEPTEEPKPEDAPVEDVVETSGASRAAVSSLALAVFGLAGWVLA